MKTSTYSNKHSLKKKSVQLKKIIKESLEEVIVEKKDFFYDMVLEALEDICIVNAIKEGEKTKSVKRETVFNILEGK